MSAHAVGKFYKSQSPHKGKKDSPTRSRVSETKVTSSGEDLKTKSHLKREARDIALSSTPVKKKCYLIPEPLWKVFPRQQMAFDFSQTCYQNSAVFSFESEEFGTTGQRKYLVTTYYEFGQRYLIIADLMRGVFYQKCHDPHCKRVNFRGNEKPLPADCCPVARQPTTSEELDMDMLIGDITDEDMREMEADTLDNDHETQEQFGYEHIAASHQTVESTQGPHTHVLSVHGKGSKRLNLEQSTIREDGIYYTPVPQRPVLSTLVPTSVEQPVSTSRLSPDSVDGLMLAALDEYETAVGALSGVTDPATEVEADFNMSLEEMNSFCEDIDEV